MPWLSALQGLPTKTLFLFWVRALAGRLSKRAHYSQLMPIDRLFQGALPKFGSRRVWKTAASGAQSVEQVLALWKIGLFTDDAVIAWADDQIRASTCASQDVVNLALWGPEKSLKQPVYEFSPRPLEFTFHELFSVLAPMVDLDCDAEATHFLEWAARHAMGESLDEPLVVLSYELDQAMDNYQNPGAALLLLQKELPLLLPHCEAIAAEVFGLMPNAPLKSQ